MISKNKGDEKMAHKVQWIKKYFDIFVEEGCLNDFEIEVMKRRVKNMPVSIMADELNCSKSTVERTITKLKVRYDEVQKHHPELPVRIKNSPTEKYMDTH